MDDFVVRAAVDDVVRCIPFWIPGVAEAGMPYVDAGVDDRDLDAVAGALRARGRQLPCLKGIDQPEVRVVVRCGAVESLVFGVQDLRRRADRGEAGAVQLNGDGIERYVKLAGHPSPRSVLPEPLLEVVSKCRELRSMGLHAVAREVDLLAFGRSGLFVGCKRSAFELYERAGLVDSLPYGGRARA